MFYFYGRRFSFLFLILLLGLSFSQSVSNVILYSKPYGLNLTSENLTVSFDLTDASRGIIDWRKWNGSAFSSLSLLNMPFEFLPKNHTAVTNEAAVYYFDGNLLDSTSYGHNAINGGATLTDSTLGKINQGYYFAGTNTNLGIIYWFFFMRI